MCLIFNWALGKGDGGERNGEKIKMPLSLLSHCACVLICFSRVQPFVTPWTVACQAPLSMGFSRQEYWSGLPFPSPGALPHLGIKPGLLHCQVGSLALAPTREPHKYVLIRNQINFCQFTIYIVIFEVVYLTFKKEWTVA